MTERSSNIPRVVLSPEVVARSFFDRNCRQVLHLWREGRFRPVVTPDLLREYVRLLQALSIPVSLIRQWIAWFTSPEKSVYVDADESGETIGDVALCLEAARVGQSNRIVVLGRRIEETSPTPVSPSIAWLSPSEFVSQIGAEK